MSNILLIDDHKAFCEHVQKTLSLHNFHLEFATDVHLGLEMALSQDWGTILLDVVLNQDLNGIQLLKQIINEKPHIPVIMISGASTLDTAVEATKIGAYDFLEKPLNVNRLLLTINRALEKNRLTSSNQALINELSERIQLVGRSKAMQKIFSKVDSIAKTDAKVFVWGESGVGKDLLAKIIHYRSHRESFPIVTINCAALPENLIESELFGYVKGAFTGADEQKEGLIAQAEGGTLYLDEITEMSLQAQAKLLKFLQDGQYTPIGGTKVRQSNVRIISSTNRDIHKEIQEGRFRQDLFYRLNVVNLFIPPLRERKEDIPPLAEFFLREACNKFGKKITHFSEQAMYLLKNMTWAGNVRQLRSAVERMVLFSNVNFIDYGTAATAIQMDRTYESVMTTNSYQQALKEFERLYFLNLVHSQNGDLKKCAELAGLPLHHLQQKLEILNIPTQGENPIEHL